MGVRQVSGPVRAGHDSRHRWEEDADQDGEGGGDVGVDLIIGRPPHLLDVLWVSAVGNELSLFQERGRQIVEEHSAGQTLDAAHDGHVVAGEIRIAHFVLAEDVPQNSALVPRTILVVHVFEKPISQHTHAVIEGEIVVLVSLRVIQ